MKMELETRGAEVKSSEAFEEQIAAVAGRSQFANIFISIARSARMSSTGCLGPGFGWPCVCICVCVCVCVCGH